jgi:hypothetical protein
LNNSNLAGNTVHGIRVASLKGVWFVVVVGGVDSGQVGAFVVLLVLGAHDGLRELRLLEVMQVTHEPFEVFFHSLLVEWCELDLARVRFDGPEILQNPLNLTHQNTVREVKTYQEAYPYYNSTRNTGQHALAMRVALIAQAIYGRE